MKELTARLLCAAGIGALARRRRRGQLTILMFHGVEAQRLSPPCWHVLDVAKLRRQLNFVRRRFHVLPLDEALEQLRNGTLPDRAATVTFDDGTRNLATHAAPVLRSLGLPAAIFLVTGPMGSAEALWPDRLWLAFANATLHEVDLTGLGLGTRSLRSAADRGETYGLAVHSMKELPDEERITRLEALVAILGAERDTEPGPFQLLSWDEARAVARDADVTLYPHTVTHPILSRCSDEKVEREVVESCVTLERETGRADGLRLPQRPCSGFRRACQGRIASPWRAVVLGDNRRVCLPRLRPAGAATLRDWQRPLGCPVLSSRFPCTPLALSRSWGTSRHLAVRGQVGEENPTVGYPESSDSEPSPRMDARICARRSAAASWRAS